MGRKKDDKNSDVKQMISMCIIGGTYSIKIRLLNFKNGYTLENLLQML
jgi:hypothetical protein